MAKISFEFDTVEKSMSVKMDGKDMANVMGVSCYRNYGEKDEYCIGVSMMEANDDEGFRTVTSVYASEQKPAVSDVQKALEAEGVKVTKVESAAAAKVQQDVLDYFKG